MLKNKKNSQIATILTLIMAVIFLFVVITINIGNVAQEKTMISNAADGAALLLSSMLGSLANALRMKLGLYHGKTENCDLDFSLIVAILSLVAAIAAAIATIGAATPAVIAALTWAGVAVSTVFFGLGMWNALVAEPGVFKQIELKFQNMTLEQRMKEKALQYALFAVVSDPNKLCSNGQAGDPKDKECGGCSDPDDLNMNGDTTDCIHYFSKWYNDRLKALPRLGEIVQALYEKIFSQDMLGQKAPRIYVWEDPQTWQAIENEYGLWIDTDGDNLPNPKQGSLRLEVESDEPTDPQGVVYAHDIYFTDWLEQRFPPLIQRLQQYGYGLSLDLDDTLDQIDKLKDGIKDFEKEMSKLYGATFESRLESFDVWILLFYDGTDKEDWCSRMQEWLDLVTGWRDILQQRTDEINQCVSSCKAAGPYKCGNSIGAQVCGQECVPVTDEDGNVDDCGSCKPNRWCKCAPVGMNGGRLCPSGQCRPQQTCVTPFDGSKHCCNIADNGLYYQLCDARTYSSGGSGGACSAAACQDTYYNCVFNPDNNVITREHAVEYLTQFVNDVQVIKDAFEEAYTEGKSKENDPRFYEVLYEWDDKVAKGEIGEQKVHHIAYVKLSENLRPDNDFKVPYIHNYREWLVKKCATVKAESGSFDITVARYDQDVGGTQSPLRNLWIFKTRRNPAQTEQILSGYTAYTDPAADPSTYAAKAAFVLGNGVVAQTEGHYGPGETYTKDELKAWGTEAAQRNKDIYIKRLK